MFEAGKSYIWKNDKHSSIRVLAKCPLVKGRFSAAFESNGQHIWLYEDNFKDYMLYVAPVKHVFYINVYGDGRAYIADTRRAADFGAVEGRIACKKVVVTYGEFDD